MCKTGLGDVGLGRQDCKCQRAEKQRLYQDGLYLPHSSFLEAALHGLVDPLAPVSTS